MVRRRMSTTSGSSRWSGRPVNAAIDVVEGGLPAQGAGRDLSGQGAIALVGQGGPGAGEAAGRSAAPADRAQVS